MIKATLSPGGLLESDPCVYILTLTAQGLQKMYVGRTGTSNNTGTSTPYKRLASHLAKRGKTMSCIHQDNKFPAGFLAKASIKFVAVPVPPNTQKDSERWVRWKFGSQKLLNKDKAPIHEPELPNEIKIKLKRLYQAAIKG